MPDFSFAAGNRPTAAQWNSWVRDQVITDCTSSTRPASPVTGRRIFESDTLREYRWNGSSWVLVKCLGAWDAWTPGWTQGVALTSTPAGNESIKEGREVSAGGNWTFTSAGTAASRLIVPLPYAVAAALASNHAVGVAHFVDAGSTIYSGVVATTSTTTAGIQMNNSGDLFGNSPAVTIASGDSVSVQLNYRAAS